MIDTELRGPAHGFSKNKRIIFNKIRLGMIFGDAVMIVSQGIMRHIRERGPVIPADGFDQPVMECPVLGVPAKQIVQSLINVIRR